MFAVPGWSLSADKLKTETAGPASSGVSTGAGAASAAFPSQQSKSKKRKRSRAPAAVTQDNVADLWERIIEHREDGDAHKNDGSGGQRDKKRAKVEKTKRSGHGEASKQKPAVTPDAPQEELKQREPEKPKKDKKRKGKKKRDSTGPSKDEEDQPKPPAAAAPPPHPPPPAAAPAPPKLTPLQASMRSKLISARFRHLNETLYTRPSAEAFSLFGESPEMFAEYHEGFRQQVGVWPENPVDGYIADIRARAAVRPPPPAKDRRGGHHNRQQQQQNINDNNKLQPLPRTEGTCRIADLGCGDGRLGAELIPQSRKLRLEVLSFDLQSPSPHVTAADMASLPLADGSVDVAIFCLALMGTNWPAFVEEAYRVLHWKGELWVAEIKSRFAAPRQKKAAGGPAGSAGGVVEHSVGNRRKGGAAASAGGKKGADSKSGGAGDEPDQAEALAIEVDGAEDRRSETDVSAFVEVLKRRGFVLYGNGGEPAPDSVDLSNRMFVKMRFLKAATPTVGKGAPKPKPQMPLDRGLGGGALSKKRFIDSGDQLDGVDEAKILKPCVYKIR